MGESIYSEDSITPEVRDELIPCAKFVAKQLHVRVTIELELIIKVLYQRREGYSVSYLDRYGRETIENLEYEHVVSIYLYASIFAKLEVKKEEFIMELRKSNLLSDEVEASIKECDNKITLKQIVETAKMKEVNKYENNRSYNNYKKMIVEKRYGDMLDGIRNKNVNKGLTILAAYNAYKEMERNNALEDYDEIVEDNMAIISVISEEAMYDIKKCEKYKDFFEEKCQYLSEFKNEEKINKYGYQLLKIWRGQKDKAISVEYFLSEDKANEIKKDLKEKYFGNSNNNKEIETFINDSCNYLYANFIKFPCFRRCFKKYKNLCRERAISVYKKHLKELLYLPPIKDEIILGIDPGYKNGCKCVIIDKHGVMKDNFKFMVKPDFTLLNSKKSKNKTMKKNEKGKKEEDPKKKLENYIKKYNVTLIAIGNGTGSYEVQSIVVDIIKSNNKLDYVIVDECGSSVYSTTKEAKDSNIGVNPLFISALSIAKRVYNPISEYVKIPPQSLGVGQYQYEIKGTVLTESLNNVIDECVNCVGIDINYGSVELFSHISGFNKDISKKCYEYVKKNRITKRDNLNKIPGMNNKIYQQCAGFICIEDSVEPLDSTIIHPKDYDYIRKKLSAIGVDSNIFKQNNWREVLKSKFKENDFDGERKYIYEYITSDNIDPRNKSDVIKKMKISAIPSIIEEGVTVEGRIASITDFGVFVDINLGKDMFIYKPDVKSIKKELVIGNYIKAKITRIEYGRIQYVREDMFSNEECERIRNRFYRKEHPLYQDIGLRTNGTIVKVAKGYAIVEDDEGFVGLISISKNMKKKVKVGDRLNLKVAFISISRISGVIIS